MKWWELHFCCLVLIGMAGCAPKTEKPAPVLAPLPQAKTTAPESTPKASLGKPEVETKPPASPIQTSTPLVVIPRSSWDNTSPDLSNLNYMSGVWKISIHHSGGDPFDAEDRDSTAAFLKSILRTHRNRRAFADIGYHFAIDPAGRVWECRSMKYQGAHVKDRNEHNAGIVLLGNFNIQKPTAPQLKSLKALVHQLMQQYRVDAKDIRTHGERMQTECPGANLQKWVEQFRAQQWR